MKFVIEVYRADGKWEAEVYPEGMKGNLQFTGWAFGASRRGVVRSAKHKAKQLADEYRSKADREVIVYEVEP